MTYWMYVAVLLVPTIASLAAVDPVECGVRQDQDITSYNYFTLVRQWIPNRCYQAKCARIPDWVDYWTLHGLWPSNHPAQDPAECGGKFDLVELDEDLVDKLHKVWTSTSTKNDDMAFWIRQYCKHGTCCKDVYPDPHSYFRGVLELNTEYEMDTILKTAGIVPSYEGYDFALLDAALGPTATYRCRVPPDGSSKQLLTEIYICLDKTRTRKINCPPGDPTKIRRDPACDKDQQFYIRPFSELF